MIHEPCRSFLNNLKPHLNSKAMNKISRASSSRHCAFHKTANQSIRQNKVAQISHQALGSARLRVDYHIILTGKGAILKNYQILPIQSRPAEKLHKAPLLRKQFLQGVVVNLLMMQMMKKWKYPQDLTKCTYKIEMTAISKFMEALASP